MDVNIRAVVLDILTEIEKEGEFSHITINNALLKYQYLDRTQRAFINRLSLGTIECRIEMDYILNQYSKTPVNKMKPLIRRIMRMAVYQIIYMENVPDSAACNEAVKLAAKRGFTGLKGFVNGVLRNISRNDMYITNNHHEAIVDKEIFYAVQQLRQSKVKNGERNRRYPLSGKVICAMCGKSYARMKYGNSIGWGCRKCENTNIINETVLIELLRSFISTVFINKEKVKKELVDALMNSYDFMNCENQINQLHKDIGYIRRRMKLYLDDYLEEKISIEVYKENKLKEEKELEAKEKELQALEMKESNNDMKNAIHHIVKVIEKKVEIDKGVIHQIIIQYIKAIIPKKMNEYHLYMDLSDCYFKENVDLSQFEYVKTYIFDLQDYQSPYVKKKYKQLQNTKLHLYIRRLSL